MSKVMSRIITLSAIAVLTTSCVAGPNPLENQPGPNGKVANFLNGYWDGTISPITLTISWFNPNVEIYNPNSDSWHPLGFMLGVGVLAGGSSASRD